MSNYTVIKKGEYTSTKQISDKKVIGMKFNRLTVVGIERRSNENRKYMKCICDCQQGKPLNDIQYTYARLNSLLRGVNEEKGGVIKSCGCYHSETSTKQGKNNKKNNIYDLNSYEYGVGYINDNDKFYFDKEDYDLIKDYCWYKHNDGYIRTCCGTYIDENNKKHNKYIMMHQLIGQKYKLYNPEIQEELDHIDGRTNNNRKNNLRSVNHMTNMKNGKIKSNNKSGYKGVWFNKNTNKWIAYITNEKKRIYLGTFINKEDAIRSRKDAEKKYFGEYNREEKYL